MGAKLAPSWPPGKCDKKTGARSTSLRYRILAGKKKSTLRHLSSFTGELTVYPGRQGAGGKPFRFHRALHRRESPSSVERDERGPARRRGCLTSR